ncbi:MAG TPA: MogA/MoaB family molybdenum cofactor biosynthesis protein [Terriglobales bacterium]|nr:MogA/MoaB family molybdenum cofactor biosynthesis protein [Terriglobales bacterium]
MTRIRIIQTTIVHHQTAAVLTVSDSCSRGERADLSGPATAELLRQHDFEVTHQEIVPDERQAIEAALTRLSEQVRLIVTTGGTGIAERDVTPEATRAVCSKLIDGIPEKMRAVGLAQTPFAILSRGVCGVRGRTLILNLPGSPNAAVQSLHAVIDVLPHAVELLAGKTAHG